MTTGKKIGWIVGATGAAAFAAGTLVGIKALADHSAATSACPVSPCADASAVATNNHAQTEAWVSDFAIGTGLVALGVGAWLVFFRHEEPRAASRQTTFAPAVLPGGGAISLSGAF